MCQRFCCYAITVRTPGSGGGWCWARPWSKLTWGNLLHEETCTWVGRRGQEKHGAWGPFLLLDSWFHHYICVLFCFFFFNIYMWTFIPSLVSVFAIDRARSPRAGDVMASACFVQVITNLLSTDSHPSAIYRYSSTLPVRHTHERLQTVCTLQNVCTYLLYCRQVTLILCQLSNPLV